MFGRSGVVLVGLVGLLLLVAAQCGAGEVASPATAAAPTPPLDERLLAPPTVQPTAVLVFPTVEPGDGSDLLDAVLERGVLRVGIRVWPDAAFVPPAFRGGANAATGGALSGFEVDLAHLLAQGLGVELELIEAYPPDILGGAWRGRWDIALASLVPFDGSEQGGLHYSQPYGYMPMGVLVPEGEENIRGWADLAGKRVAVLEYSAYERLVRADEPPAAVGGQPLLPEGALSLEPVAVSNLPKAIRQLGREGEVQAVFGPTPMLEEAARSGEPVKLAAEAGVVGFQPLVVATVPQDGLQVERLLQTLNRVLDRLHRRGVLAEMYLRWYGQDLSRVGPPGTGTD